MNALPYYPRYPRDFFEGTVGMNGELKGTYSMLIDLMMMMGDRGLPDDPHFIAGHMGHSVRKWNLLRKKLIEAGKIDVCSGIISNKRADKEQIKLRSYRDKQAENGAGSNENKDLKNPPPTEPESEPEEEVKRDTKVSPKNKRGTRLPQDWVLPKAWGEWGISEGWAEDQIRAESDKFKDYWHSVAGAKGVKLDWLATWRNWLRNSNAPKQSQLKAIHGGRTNDKPTDKLAERGKQRSDDTLRNIARLAGIQ